MAAALRAKQQQIFQMADKVGFTIWEAKDIYQDVCLVCIEKAATTRIDVAVAYVHTVASNLIADACDDRNINSDRHVALDGETLERCAKKIAVESSSPEEDQLERIAKRTEAKAIMDRVLSPAVKKVIQLSLIEGLEDNEIAEHLNITLANVRKP